MREFLFYLVVHFPKNKDNGTSTFLKMPRQLPRAWRRWAHSHLRGI